MHTFELTTIIRGHHVYHDQWSGSVGKKLTAAPDPRAEAIQYDENAIGAYNGDQLVGHLPVEVSKLFKQFVTKDRNRVDIVVVGKRKREVGMVLPVKCKAFTSKKSHMIAFSDSLVNHKELFPGLDLMFTPVNDSHAFATYN